MDSLLQHMLRDSCTYSPSWGLQHHPQALLGALVVQKAVNHPKKVMITHRSHTENIMSPNERGFDSSRLVENQFCGKPLGSAF